MNRGKMWGYLRVCPWFSSHSRDRNGVFFQQTVERDPRHAEIARGARDISPSPLQAREDGRFFCVASCLIQCLLARLR